MTNPDFEKELTTQQRRQIGLCFFKGLTVEQIANNLDIDKQTVTDFIRRKHKNLSERVLEDDDE